MASASSCHLVQVHQHPRLRAAALHRRHSSPGCLAPTSNQAHAPRHALSVTRQNHLLSRDTRSLSQGDRCTFSHDPAMPCVHRAFPHCIFVTLKADTRSCTASTTRQARLSPAPTRVTCNRMHLTRDTPHQACASKALPAPSFTIPHGRRRRRRWSSSNCRRQAAPQPIWLIGAFLLAFALPTPNRCLHRAHLTVVCIVYTYLTAVACDSSSGGATPPSGLPCRIPSCNPLRWPTMQL